MGNEIFNNKIFLKDISDNDSEEFLAAISDDGEIVKSTNEIFLRKKVKINYIDTASLIADQSNQNKSELFYIEDGSYYQYKGTTNGNISDYRLVNINKEVYSINIFNDTNLLKFDNVFGNIYNRSSPNDGDFLLSTEDEVIDGKCVVYSVGNQAPIFSTDRNIYNNGAYVADGVTINKIDIVRTIEGYNLTYKEIETFDPLSNLTMLAYYNVQEGSIVSSGNITALTDLTGNGNDINMVGTVPYIEDGINGVPSAYFDGTTHGITAGDLTSRADLSKVVIFGVFKITNSNSGSGFHSIAVLGFENYNTGSPGVLQVASTNDTDEIIVNYNNNALDDTFNKPQTEAHSFLAVKDTNESSFSVDGLPLQVKVGVLNILDNPVLIGGVSGGDAKVMISEIGIMDNDTNTLSTQDIDNLNKRFKQKYNITQKPQVTIFNQGGNGNNTQDVINRIATIKADNPDAVFLMIGTNDWRHPTPSQRLTPAQYKTNLLAIIDDFQSNSIDVHLMSFPPILNELNGMGDPSYDYVCTAYGESLGCDVNATSQEFRDKINEVLVERNLKSYIDINQFFINNNQPDETIDSWVLSKANNGGALDGVHLSNVGHEKVTEEILKDLYSNNYGYNSISFVGDSITVGDGLTPREAFPYLIYNKINK